MGKLKKLRERICALTAVAALLLTTVLPAMPVAAEDPATGGEGSGTATAIEYMVNVVDDAANGLPGVSVTAQIAGDDTSIVTAETEQDGTAKLLLQEGTEYTVTCSKDGYIQNEECKVTAYSDSDNNQTTVKLGYRVESIIADTSLDLSNWVCGDTVTFRVNSASENNTLAYSWKYDENMFELVSSTDTAIVLKAVKAVNANDDTLTIQAVNQLGQASNVINVKTVKKELNLTELTATTAEDDFEEIGGNKYPKKVTLNVSTGEPVICDTGVAIFAIYEDKEQREQIGTATISAGESGGAFVYEKPSPGLITGEYTFSARIIENDTYYTTSEKIFKAEYDGAVPIDVDVPTIVSNDFKIMIESPDNIRKYTYNYSIQVDLEGRDELEGIVENPRGEITRRGSFFFDIQLNEDILKKLDDSLTITLTVERENNTWGMPGDKKENIQITIIPKMVNDTENGGIDNPYTIIYSKSAQEPTDIFKFLKTYQQENVSFEYEANSDKIEFSTDGKLFTNDVTGDEPVKIDVKRVESGTDNIIDSATCYLVIARQKIDDLSSVSVNINAQRASKDYDGNKDVPENALIITPFSGDPGNDGIKLKVNATTESKNVKVDQKGYPIAQKVELKSIELSGDAEVVDRYFLDENAVETWINSINNNTNDNGLEFTITPKVLHVDVSDQQVEYGKDAYNSITEVNKNNYEKKYSISGYENKEKFEQVFDSESFPQIAIDPKIVDNGWVKVGTKEGALSIDLNTVRFRDGNYNYKIEDSEVTKGTLRVDPQNPKHIDARELFVLSEASSNCYYDAENQRLWAKIEKDENDASQDGEAYTEENFEGAKLILTALESSGYNKVYYVEDDQEIDMSETPLKIKESISNETPSQNQYKLVFKRIVGSDEFASLEYTLTVNLDNSSPKITSSLSGVTKAVSTWCDIITLGFGDYANEDQIIKANITFEDPAGVNSRSESDGSGVASIEYKSVKITENGFNEDDIEKEAMSETGYQYVEDLENNAEVIIGSGTEEDIEEGNYILFVRATDNVGNGCIYVSTGAIYDYTAPSVKIVRQKTPISYNGTLPVYNDDIDMAVFANDFLQNSTDPGSGVESIKLTITSTNKDGETIETPIEPSWENKIENETPSLTEIQEENASLENNGAEFLIDKENHNSNDIQVTAVVTDRAGHEVTQTSEFMAIDKDAPVITYSYDNNEVKNDVYYQAPRTATITVEERNMQSDKEHLYIALKTKGQEAYSTYSYDELMSGQVPGVSADNYYDPQVSEEKRTAEEFDDNRTITFDLTFSGDNEYEWYCYVKDSAENSAKTDSDFFVVDNTDPVLNDGGVKYYVDGKDVTDQVEAGTLFTQKEITAKISIDEVNFANAEDGFAEGQMSVTLIATDSEGNVVDVTQEISNEISTASSWDNWNQENGLTRVLSKTFTQDANYEFGFTYTDLAGRDVTYSTRSFTHDETKPTGSVTYDTNSGTETWEAFFNAITFNRFKQTDVTVSLKGNDATSGVKSIAYYKANTADLTYDDVAQLPEEAWTKESEFINESEFTVGPNNQFVPYLRVIDKADNVEYFNSEYGVVVDNVAAQPEIEITMAEPVHGIYNSNVPFHISVTDPTVGDTYAGLQSVYYEVRRDGQVTQSGNYDSDLQPASRRVKNIERDETVNAELNNSNNVEIYVRAVDNAGNTAEDTVQLKIDITDPTIQVTYDLNSPLNERYYNATRTATVTVTERNFDESAVRFNITNTDGTMPSISGWSHSADSGVSDNATHTCYVTFAADGDYTLTLNTTDLAGNDSHYTQVDDFTIDQTDPTIQVSYDNNSDAENGYFNAERTATITVTEHNFNAAEVNAAITARLQGTGVSAPGLGSWSTRGDVHTASVRFSADADYTFDVDYTDLAGNAAADYQGDTFTIDQTVPEVEFFDIVDKSANKDLVAPGVTYSDINYSESGVKITLKGAKPEHDEKELTGTRTGIANGESIKMDDFARTKENDDLYTLTAAITDKAGNVTEQSVTFSVNRFGSVYVFSDDTEKLLDDYYAKEEQDLVVTEINVDTLVNNGISYGRDGELVNLEKGSDYTVRESGSDVSWKEYQYTIDKKNFEEEGHYTVTIDSEDRATNVQNNKVKDSDIEFVIDKTAPSVVITGVENGEQYRADSRDMTVNVADNMAMGTVDIYLGDGITPDKSYKASEIERTGGALTYTIGNADEFQDVRAVARDAAGNEAETEGISVLVTSNLLIQYVNNTPLLVGSIIVVLLIAGGACWYFLIFKKKKNEQAK